MALHKTVTTVQGFDAVDAYHRIEGLTIDTKSSITFHVRSYKDTSGLPHFADRVLACPYVLDGANPLVQAYVYIKTLPEFSGASDC